MGAQDLEETACQAPYLGLGVLRAAETQNVPPGSDVRCHHQMGLGAIGEDGAGALALLLAIGSHARQAISEGDVRVQRGAAGTGPLAQQSLHAEQSRRHHEGDLGRVHVTLAKLTVGAAGTVPDHLMGEAAGDSPQVDGVVRVFEHRTMALADDVPEVLVVRAAGWVVPTLVAGPARRLEEKLAALPLDVGLPLVP